MCEWSPGFTLLIRGLLAAPDLTGLCTPASCHIPTVPYTLVESLCVPIGKIGSEEQRLFGGWAYVARMPDGTLVEDYSGDVIDTPEAWNALVKAFLKYALVGREGDLMHSEFGAADLEELFICDAEKRGILGLPEGVLPDGIYVSFKARETPAGERLWKGVKNGTIRALSIVGAGYREDLDDEGED